MASSNDWLPSRLAEVAVVMQNILDKISGYTAILPLTAGQVTEIENLCAMWLAAYMYTEQYRASSGSTVTWRDSIFNGVPTGSNAPEPPAPPTFAMPVGATIGVMKQLRDFRDIIQAAPGYTDAIGADLMLVATGGGPGPSIPVGDAVPSIKCDPAAGYEIDITGAMHGMDAMRIEWQANGSATWSLVGFLTKTPGHVIISVPTPGEPVSGRIRARYIHNNDPVGDYSQEAAVTVSA